MLLHQMSNLDRNFKNASLSLYPSHRKSSFDSSKKEYTVSHSAMPGSSWLLHNCSPLDLKVAACVSVFLKPQTLAAATGVHQRTLRFLTLTHTAYGAGPNCSRLRAGRLENPPKSVAERLD